MLKLDFIKRKRGESKEDMLKAVFYGKKEKAEAIFVNFIDFIKIYAFQNILKF